MSRMKRCIALMLVAIMLLSILSLSGCKKKDGDSTDPGVGNPSTPSDGVDDDGHDNSVEGGENDPEFDARILPVGFMTTPVDESVIRGAEAQGSFTITEGQEDSAVLIPIDSVPQGIIISVPVEFGDVTFPIMAYAAGAGEREFRVAFGVSACDGICDGVGYSQVNHLGENTYIVCNDCGQVLRMDVMEVDNQQSRIYCYPWSISSDAVQEVTATESMLTSFGPYNWINTEETGDYSTGVPFVKPASLVNTRCILVPYSVLKEAYDTFMSWEQQRNEAVASAAGSSSAT